ncbi:MAG: presenilin family intramembrane aspartyl protease [Candidatus Marsarchaeota archaeon]|nr:presenilin family intramembrane aspartyl protease [Candidatus Marsarchaeota archaeon]
MERRIDIRQLVMVAALFLIAQFAGLLLVYTSVPPNAIPGLVAQAAQPQTSASIATYIITIAVEIVIIAAVVMFFVRSYKRRNFFTLMEAYIVLLGSFFFFFILVGDVLPWAGAAIPAALSALFAVAVYLAKRSRRMNTSAFRNVVTIITSIGVGTFIGESMGIQFGVIVLYATLALFAVYDFLAVFVIKFMIPLAKQAVSMNLAFMIGSSEMELRPQAKGKPRSYTAKELRMIKDPGLRRLIKQGNAPTVSNIMLGNGDIMLPLLVASGAYVSTASLSLAITIVIGAAAGLLMNFWIIRKYMLGLPAIPLIFAFVSVSLALFYSLLGAFFLVYIYAGGAVLSIIAMYFGVAKALHGAADERRGATGSRTMRGARER